MRLSITTGGTNATFSYALHVVDAGMNPAGGSNLWPNAPTLHGVRHLRDANTSIYVNGTTCSISVKSQLTDNDRRPVGICRSLTTGSTGTMFPGAAGNRVNTDGTSKLSVVSTPELGVRQFP